MGAFFEVSTIVGSDDDEETRTTSLPGHKIQAPLLVEGQEGQKRHTSTNHWLSHVVSTSAALPYEANGDNFNIIASFTESDSFDYNHDKVAFSPPAFSTKK